VGVSERESDDERERGEGEERRGEERRESGLRCRVHFFTSTLCRLLTHA